MSPWTSIGWCALAVAVLMFATWLLSIPLRNASIVDIVWGLGFVTVGWTAWLIADHHGARSLVLLIMVTLWGLRLAVYLAWRNHGKGEDFRYVAMRRSIGSHFWIVSLLTVFGLQGLLLMTVSLPLSVGIPQAAVSLGPTSYLGLAVFAVGMFFEAVGDAQLARFKADPANSGQVMDQGLWRYTRHPNYFGDFCVWWAMFAVIIGVDHWEWTVIGPIAMTVLLLRVSGVALLEKSIGRRRPGYEAYVARTSAFIPRPPRRVAKVPDAP
jgi:steroid 5-alpha reductase family enzyme